MREPNDAPPRETHPNLEGMGWETITDMSERLDAMRRDLGLDDRILARILGVNKKTLTRWTSKTHEPQPAHAQAIERVWYIHNALAATLGRDGIERYLKTYSPSLGFQRPLDLLIEGKWRAVLKDLSEIRGGKPLPWR